MPNHSVLTDITLTFSKNNFAVRIGRHISRPAVAGEFDDSALIKVFGQEGHGVFVAPEATESAILRQYQVQIVGRPDL